jgi:hypothetical protein
MKIAAHLKDSGKLLYLRPKLLRGRGDILFDLG